MFNNRNSSLFRRSSIGALAASAALLAAAPAQAAPADVYLEGGGGTYLRQHVRSFSEMRFATVEHQRYDYSCGSAAVATLLSYHYRHPIAEKDVLQSMYENGDQEKIRRLGFSLLDMKNYLQSIGYHAEGYRESLDKLQKVGIPAIVLVNRRGYMHFVVIKGVSRDKVAVGDPSLGQRIYNRDDFEKIWNGILFVILDNKSIGQSSFNTKAAWSPFGHPYFNNMLNTQELSNLAIETSLSPNYY